MHADNNCSVSLPFKWLSDLGTYCLLYGLFSFSYQLQSFLTLGDLTRHKRYHTGERPYKCTECDKRFTEAGHLRTHLRSHTGERPYKCSWCARDFTSLANLRAHEELEHAEVKRFRCSICDKVNKVHALGV